MILRNRKLQRSAFRKFNGHQNSCVVFDWAVVEGYIVLIIDQGGLIGSGKEFYMSPCIWFPIVPQSFAKFI